MNYQETVQYLFSSAPLFQNVGGDAYKEGLSNTHVLDKHFGHPHTHYETIHVAGTNGKGSCAHTLAAMLQSHGLRVGLYTSPHLVDFRERIRVNGEMIPEDYVVDFVREERAFFEPLHPSFFELTTALAFKYFEEVKADVAVIEVGLGGRLDCTNIITPKLSLITNISLDHTQFLGDTLGKIAREKAGIIKHGVPVVVGEAVAETRPVFQRQADEVGAPVTFAEDEPMIIRTGVNEEGLRSYETLDYGTFLGELAGECQVKNANTLLHAALLLRPLYGITTENIHEAFRHVSELTGLMGRWQTLQSAPRVVCDTGHNPGGWQYLGHQLRLATGHYPHVHIVFGMAADKDVDTVLGELPRQAVFYWTQASVHRAMNAERLQALALSHSLEGLTFPDVQSAYTAALSAARPDDFVFVGGSSFVVADLLTYLQSRP